MGSIYLAALRNPSLVSTYQTNPGMLYGTPFATGMENYFQKIKNYFGQSMFDQLVTEFAQQSNLYVDEIKIGRTASAEGGFCIYGSSRLGIYEANRTISRRVARDLNNDNQISTNEYVVETPEEVLYLYSSYQLERGAKRYELANHLGNVLTVISDKKTANFTGSTFTHFTAERISATDYSPFGAPLAGRTWQAQEYRFGFNSMEKDNEINGTGNAYDFGARIYDARLGRWMSVNLLEAKYPDLTPFQYCVNSPLILKDFNGKDFIVTITKSNDGTTHIKLSATVYVVGATKEQVDEMNRFYKEILKEGKSGNTLIEFDVQFKALPLDVNELNLVNIIGNPSLHKDPSNQHSKGSSGKDGANVLFTDGPAGFSSHVNSLEGKPTNIGVLNPSKKNDTESFAKEAFHESLHFLGLSDRYTDATKIVVNPSTGRPQSKRITKPLPGWENDVLAALCVTGFNQTHYDNIADFFKGKAEGVIEVKTSKTGFIDVNESGGLKGTAK